MTYLAIIIYFTGVIHLSTTPISLDSCQDIGTIMVMSGHAASAACISAEDMYQTRSGMDTWDYKDFRLST